MVLVSVLPQQQRNLPRACPVDCRTLRSLGRGLPVRAMELGVEGRGLLPHFPTFLDPSLYLTLTIKSEHRTLLSGDKVSSASIGGTASRWLSPSIGRVLSSAFCLQAPLKI